MPCAVATHRPQLCINGVSELLSRWWRRRLVVVVATKNEQDAKHRRRSQGLPLPLGLGEFKGWLVACRRGRGVCLRRRVNKTEWGSF